MIGIIVDDLEHVIDGWEYWCWDNTCKNRTFWISNESGDDILLSTNSETGEKKLLKVRLLICQRCHKPTVLGTYRYWDTSNGWATRGEIVPSSIAKMMDRADITSWSAMGDNSFLAVKIYLLLLSLLHAKEHLS